MKILMLAQRLPYPPDKGEKIRSFHELMYLTERHDVWCACLVDDPADLKHLEALRQRCRDVAAIPLRRPFALLRGAASLLAGGSITEGYFGSRRFAAVVARWSEQVGFDAVLAFSSSIAPYGLAVLARRRVVDLCDVDSAKWASYASRKRRPVRWAFAIEASRLARREWELAAAYDVAMVITAREAERFELSGRAIGPAARGPGHPDVLVVRNGVDLHTIKPQPEVVREPVIGFVGTMNYPPNVEAVCWFGRHVWPAIRHARPEARFLIVGRSPNRRVRALKKLQGVDVTGMVPDTLEHLRRMQVCVVPLQMVHGLPNKVLEAMASAKPVVTTPPVARAIGASPDRDLVVADEPVSFAEEVLGLLGDAGRRHALGLSARRFVESEYRWEDQLAKLDKALCAAPDGEKPEPCDARVCN